jgi:hypothetical protein
MPSHELTIDPGFAGMPGVAHGGYVAGPLTVALGASGTRVRLRRPVPTGRALQIEHAAGAQIELRNRERLLAEGAAADVLVRVPDAVSAREAEAATQRFADLAHPFPMCVCCGPDHAGGLHVFPGPVAGRGVVAAHWVPSERLAGADGRLPRELVCAALDCAQLWALMLHSPPAMSDRSGVPDSQTVSILVGAGDRARGERLDRRRETRCTRTSEMAALYHVTVRSLGRFGGESGPGTWPASNLRDHAGVVWS